MAITIKFEGDQGSGKTRMSSAIQDILVDRGFVLGRNRKHDGFVDASIDDIVVFATADQIDKFATQIFTEVNDLSDPGD